MKKQIIYGYYTTTTGQEKPISFIAKTPEAFVEKAKKELAERNIPYKNVYSSTSIQKSI